jgi:hypothetical protein
MRDDIERRLSALPPRGAPPELRSRVLAAVEAQLRQPDAARSRWLSRLAIAGCLALGLVGGVLTNRWVNDELDRRLAIVLGLPAAQRNSAAIAADVASITDPATARWAYERLALGAPRAVSTHDYALRLRGLIRQFTVDLEENADEATRKDRQMDRDRRSRLDCHPADAQCLLRVEYRYTA